MTSAVLGSNYSTVNSEVDKKINKKIKEKFFPCTSSFLSYIRDKIVSPSLRFFAINIQTLYPFQCKNCKEFRLDPKFLAEMLGYKSVRTPQRFIAELIEVGILERVGGKYQQLYRWVKKFIPTPTKEDSKKKTESSEKRKSSPKPKSPNPTAPAVPVAEERVEVVEEKAEAIADSGSGIADSRTRIAKPVTDPHFGVQPTRNQWGQKDYQPNPDKLVPDGPWKNEHGRIHPHFMDWSAKRWIKARKEQYPYGDKDKESMSIARMQVRGFYSVKPKETEALTQMDYDKKVTNLQNYWEEYSVEFNELKENYETRQVGIKGEELKRFSEMAQAIQPELIQVEEPAPAPKINPARKEQGDQGASASNGSSRPPKNNKFLASMRRLMSAKKNDAREEAIAENKRKLLDMEPIDPTQKTTEIFCKQAQEYGLFVRRDLQDWIYFSDLEDLEF